MSIAKVLVAGGGKMGSQVAWQMATHGLEVTVYDAFEAGLARCRGFHETFSREFIEKRGAKQADMDAALARLSYSTDLKAAVADADLIVEQVPENLQLKLKFWQDVSALAPEKTIFATNTSSLRPSEIAEVVDRPEKFLAFHFFVPVWDANLVEVMALPKTDPKYRAILTELAPKIGLEPIDIRKEQPGYVVNSLLIPFLLAGLDLVYKDVADPETIDMVWRISNSSKFGPCQMMDLVGMNVVYNVVKSIADANNDADAQAKADYVKREFIDKGRLGMEAGQGFYSYPADGIQG